VTPDVPPEADAGPVCGDLRVQPGEACEQDHRCGLGQRCQACQCVPIPCSEGDGCDDGDPCHQGTCVEGACQVQALDDVPCADDGLVCTLDRCVQGTCVHAPQEGIACDDGDPCTVQTFCDGGGACVGPVPPDQDDDGVPDPCDDCPADPDPGQEDYDNDGIGEACDDLPGPWTSCPALHPPLVEILEGCIAGDLSLFQADLGPQADGVCFEGVPPLPKSGLDGLLELLVPPEWWLSVGYRIKGRLPGLFVITGCQVEWVDNPVCFGDNWNPIHAPVGALPNPVAPTDGSWRRTGYEILPNAPDKLVSVFFDTVTELITIEEPAPLPYELCWRIQKGAPVHDEVLKPLPLTPGVPRVLESWRHATDLLDVTTCTTGGEGLAASPELAYRVAAQPDKPVLLRLEPWNLDPGDLAGQGVRLLLVNEEGRCEAALAPDAAGEWHLDDPDPDTPILVIEAGALTALLANVIAEVAP